MSYERVEEADPFEREQISLREIVQEEARTTFSFCPSPKDTQICDSLLALDSIPSGAVSRAE